MLHIIWIYALQYKKIKDKKMKVKDFDLSETLECGQCFNFEKLDENEYVVVAFKKALHVKQIKNELLFLNAKEKEIENIWIPYFDLNRDYGKIKSFIKKADPRLEPIIKENKGIRILNQDFAETLISFIISQQNQIPKIKRAVRALSLEKGKEIKLSKDIKNLTDSKFYAFPTLEALSQFKEEDFKNLSLGYRAPYLFDTAQKLFKKEISLNDFLDKKEKTLIPYEDAKKKLMALKGVGEKVANCVLLFSLGYREAFPVDTWIRKIMLKMYFSDNEKITNKEIEAFGKNLFGKYGGYAQQYLFIYAKNNRI